MAFVSDVNYPSSRLLESIMRRINAYGTQPRVIIELDKLSYVPGFRQKYDTVQYVYDSVVGNMLSIDGITPLTNETDGTPITAPTELINTTMSMPILSSRTMNGKKNDSTHINGMLITDWHDSDPRCSRKRHKGIDLDCEKGDHIHAVWGGRIVQAGWINGYGAAVYIDHGNGWSTRYAHMKPNHLLVTKGETVHAGQPIGIGWNSGLVIKGGGGDGSHLHFEVRQNGLDLNPEPFLRGEKVIQAPARILSPTQKSVQSAGTAIEYSMEATAYHAKCTGCAGITKGGTNVSVWKNDKIIAVDPSIIPLKSKVEVIVEGVSWGEYLADDIGGAIKGNKIDILMENDQKCRAFGRKQVLVRVKSWGDGRARKSDGTIKHAVSSYQFNRTTEKISYHKDFTAKKTALDPAKYTEIAGAEQYMDYDSHKKSYHLLGFKKTNAPGQIKKFTFEHDWFKAGSLGWAYMANMELEDVVQVKVDGVTVATIRGVNAKYGIAYPPSIPVPKGKHKIEFSLSNPSKASTGRFGILFLKAREFDVESINRKTVWDYEDTMSSAKNWILYQQANIKDNGAYQTITTNGKEAGLERVGRVKSFPFTIQFKVKVDKASQGKVYISDGKKGYQIEITDAGISTNGGSYQVDNKKDFVEYVVVCHNETDMDVYVKKQLPDDKEKWENTGVRGTAVPYGTNRILFAVTKGAIHLADVRYAFSNYAIEQFATHIENTYKEKWYEVGSFQYEDTFVLEDDIMSWEVNSHLDTSSTTAAITLNNATGKYSPTFERNTIFPDTYKSLPSPYSYWEEGEMRHIISEATPIRIYAGYGEDVVRIFTGLIKGEIEEDAEAKTITFHCVDRYDVLEEFVFYKPMSYPPEEAYAGDGGAYAWLKSSIVEDIAVTAGLSNWRVHYEDTKYPDYEIEDTVYIDVNKGKNTFMKFNKKTTELEAVTQESVKTVGGWQNPFVASVTFQPGTRAADAIQSLLQDMPYRAYCDRYGTFHVKRLSFLDAPQWQMIDSAKWEFVDSNNLLEMTSSTDYSRIRNHLMISGSAGLVEHFFDKSLLVATKGNIRTAGMHMAWIEEKDGATMRGLKEEIANKIFFDMKRQARTKNVVVKGNPFIELLDGCYVYDQNTYTAGYYLIKGNRLVGNESGMVNFLELTWNSLPQPK